MIKNELFSFLLFFTLGIVISCILDIFRTLRIIKKKNSIYVVAIQDIIFFSIVTIITTIGMIYTVKDRVRWYMFLALLLGIIVSRITISKALIKVYSNLFSMFSSFVKFLCVPISLWLCICKKIIKKLSKKCCKMFFLMINLKCKLLTVFGNMNNFKKVRGLFKNEKKSRKHEEKTKRQKEEKVF
ncbi:MAG: spore cortex biosynthesis protein YabQ [Clostridia bacterium]|nr:spore cortex biosynthesis protein YabQ [Clostridia bacterium]